MAEASPGGGLVAIDDTRLFVEARGRDRADPVIVLHGGPGMDHHEFGDYLDPLGADHRLLLVDQRAQGRSDPAPDHTWTLERMAQDVIMLARALDLDRYSVLGHSFGAFVALQNAVDFPGMASHTVVSSGVPSMRFVQDTVERELASFTPAELRTQVVDSWAREADARTSEDVASILADQWPFQFADPCDPRIAEYMARSAGGRYEADVLRHFASSGYGGIEVEDRLHEVASPVLVLAGRHDRTCPVAAAAAIAAGVPQGLLVIFERSAHMAFVEEQDAWLEAVGSFLAG
ncbi:MAG: alpha/beta fold hydrolase [Actinomycetota bacterium]